VYVVGGLPPAERAKRVSDVRHVHDETLVGEPLDALPRQT